MSNNEPVVEESPAKEVGQGLVESDAEYVSKEMENSEPIENDHQTVLIVANYLDANPEFA
jgi:hypothetical protein